LLDDKTRLGWYSCFHRSGVFAIGMIITTFVILKADIHHSHASVNPPSIEAQKDPFDKELIQIIEKIPSVKKVYASRGRRM
jgi:hypothetical protein